MEMIQGLGYIFYFIHWIYILHIGYSSSVNYTFYSSTMLHSIHRLDPSFHGIISVRLVCQRSKIEKHRL